jgi:Mg2+ and Co2+ transporter CorA
MNRRLKWFDFSGMLEPEVAARWTDGWKLHALAVGTATAATRSSRLQEYAEHLLLGLDALESFQDAVPAFRRIWVLAGPGFFFTFHEAEEPLIDVVRQRVGVEFRADGTRVPALRIGRRMLEDTTMRTDQCRGNRFLEAR